MTFNGLIAMENSPNRWGQHCTIALNHEDDDSVFYSASDLILHEFEKMCGDFISIELVKTTFPVEEIYAIELYR